eukprot:7141308-Prymnesium_polylepis.1
MFNWGNFNTGKFPIEFKNAANKVVLSLHYWNFMVAGADGSPAATAEDMEFDYAHGIYTGAVT